jgi:serine phosphatase RsbU (regulator of sigma subunit)
MVNDQLINNYPQARLVTAVFITMNINDMYADFIVAGHPAPFLVLENKVIQIKNANPVLGFLTDIQFSKEKVDLKPGMRLILYSDGIINAMHYSENLFCRFGKTGFIKCIEKHSEKPLKNMIENTWADTLIFCDNKPCDDMLLLGIEVPDYHSRNPQLKGGENV